MAQRIFFGQLIELYIQGYFEFLISSILTLWMHNKNLLGEQMSLMLTYFNLFMTLCFLPVSMGIIQFIDGKKLVD